ncbi:MULTISPECIES: tail fiber protein [unclassified Photorhabdus]|uniref:tail fiber protein n=1 Tax=unclassified Photorhabdus TaxID=2620880 RepID=UPI000DCB247C|nr:MULTISPECIES: tail fiber protein [unclassified Photorhabdus]RAW96101.1 phage tail protein [Photorhabdus sp. S9-53]RAW96168.1 phage tail protein [Photorhabdus sp. S10-54]RAX00228.1 phage tail protein [Photorhabdus sp. S8-52]
MSTNNDFKAFSISNNANVVSQDKYEKDQSLQAGFPPNDVPTHLLNKVLRQSSTISSVVASFIATQSDDDVLDDGNVDKLADQLNKALKQKITTEIPNASLTQKGVVQLTDVIGDSDTLAVTQKLVKEIVNSLFEEINSRTSNRPGNIYLSAYPASALAKGEYIANGDVYAIDSNVGRVLNSLPVEYKKVWRIKKSDGNINLPNLFFNGRGVFMRAGLQPGVIQEDAIRNIQGDVGWWATGLFSRVSRAFYGVKASNNASAHHKNVPDQYSIFSYATFDASQVVPTADENRPLNVSMIPIIYLGV